MLFPELGAKAYLITLLSPYAGIYYWNNAQRIDEVKVKIEISDDEQVTTVVAQGDKEDLERFSKTLSLPERGKIYVKGIFEGEAQKDSMMSNYIVLDKNQQQATTNNNSPSVNNTPTPTPTTATTTTATADAGKSSSSSSSN